MLHPEAKNASANCGRVYCIALISCVDMPMFSEPQKQLTAFPGRSVMNVNAYLSLSFSSVGQILTNSFIPFVPLRQHKGKKAAIIGEALMTA